VGYNCPECGGKAGRATPKAGAGAAALGGALLPLILFAFTFRFHCPTCVKDFRLNEMPAGTLGKALLGTLAAVMIAVALIAVLILVLTQL